MTGKNKCKILKDIRKKIAQENDIEYVTSECKFQGECTGTCPKCESEVRYLEQELAKKKAAGKAVAVAGIAAAMVVTAAGCDLFQLPQKGKTKLPEGETENYEQFTGEMGETTEETNDTTPTGEVDRAMVIGEVSYEETTEAEELWGLIKPSEDTEYILTGDVAWPN